MNIDSPDRAPRAFLSHASEDKERFAVQFAERLRAKGVDVWLDQWEIRPGDSLVRRIFTEGIDQADVFIVIASSISVGKPWVQEELDAGVVRKINGTCRLIPVVLDGVPVPPSLAHLLYVDVDRLGLDGVVAAVLRSIFQIEQKPPLGNRPSYSERQPRYLSDPIDDLVAEVVLAAFKEGRMMTGESLRASLAEAEVTPEQVDESIKSLQELGLIEVSFFLGGNYRITRVRPTFWLESERKNGVDMDRVTREVLAKLVNDGRLNPRDVDGIHELTVRSVVEVAELQGLLKVSRVLSGLIRLASASPKLLRMLRT